MTGVQTCALPILSEAPRELALKGKLSPYVTLSPQQPYVASRGWLSFDGVLEVLCEYNQAFSNNLALSGKSFSPKADVQVTIHNDAANSTYLIDCSVSKPLGGGPYEIGQPDGSSIQWESVYHLTFLLVAEVPGNYTYTISSTDQFTWYFFGCEVNRVS